MLFRVWGWSCVTEADAGGGKCQKKASLYIYMVFPSDAFEMNIATDAMG